MIKNSKQYREQNEREWAQYLCRLSYQESIEMTEDLLSCGLLEQVSLRKADRPRALRYLLHERTDSRFTP